VDTPRPEEPALHFYIAVFGVTIGTDSQVQNFRLMKVIEPLTGTNDAVNLELSKAYIDAAKKEAEAAHLKPALKDGKPSERLTAFLYIPGSSPAADASALRMSLGSLDGIMADIISFELKGQGCQASIFGKPLGASALFFTYYAVPLARGSEEERETVINAEIERCAANFGGAKVISKKILPLADQSIVEVVVKSPRSKVLSLRCRVICTARQMLALTVTTPDDSDAATIQALDKMFDEFRFR